MERRDRQQLVRVVNIEPEGIFWGTAEEGVSRRRPSILNASLLMK